MSEAGCQEVVRRPLPVFQPAAHALKRASTSDTGLLSKVLLRPLTTETILSEVIAASVQREAVGTNAL